MNLREQIMIDEAVFFNTADFAEEVVYQEKDSPDRTIVVLITNGITTRTSGNVHVTSGNGVIRVKMSDFSEKPKGSVLRADGTIWKIGREISNNHATRLLEIRTDTRAVFSGGGRA